MRFASVLILALFFFSTSCPAHERAGDLSLRREVLKVIFSGTETLHYSITWSGGVKIGDLWLSVARVPKGAGFVIRAQVKDYGLFRFFYPVDDLFTTRVRGPFKLPYRYEVLQREGHGGQSVHRLTLFDQKRFKVTSKKNKQASKTFTLSGIVYNEFSSFFITRALQLLGEKEVVPTFVDEKRHEVTVKVLGHERLETIFGPLDTLQVLPEMDFKGLYDKDGDTTFWLTDDRCRVPVVIESKILIGSLQADLEGYTNSACPERAGGDLLKRVK